MLFGTPVDFKRFEKRSVPSTDAKWKDSLDTDYPRNKRRLANRFFLKKCFLDVSLGPYRETSVTKIPLPPKRFDFFSDWVGLFEICFRSSKKTDPRPCPTGLAYLELYHVQQRCTKFKPTTNYQLQKLIFLKDQRNITGQNTSYPNVYRAFLRKKLIGQASSLNNIKAG